MVKDINNEINLLSRLWPKEKVTQSTLLNALLKHIYLKRLLVRLFIYLFIYINFIYIYFLNIVILPGNLLVFILYR